MSEEQCWRTQDSIPMIMTIFNDEGRNFRFPAFFIAYYLTILRLNEYPDVALADLKKQVVRIIALKNQCLMYYTFPICDILNID
jgi:hypothetical protein